LDAGCTRFSHHAQQARCCRPDVLRTSPALRASEVTCLPIPAMRQHDKDCLAAAFTPVAQVPPLKQTRIRVKIPRGETGLARLERKGGKGTLALAFRVHATQAYSVGPPGHERQRYTAKTRKSNTKYLRLGRFSVLYNARNYTWAATHCPRCQRDSVSLLVLTYSSTICLHLYTLGSKLPHCRFPVSLPRYQIRK